MSLRNDDATAHESKSNEILDQNPEDILYTALTKCRCEGDFRAFITDLCTRTEIQALAERLLIARLLAQGGLSYRDISAATGASTTTVGRVARFLQQEPHRGYQLVLDRLGDHDDNSQRSTESAASSAADPAAGSAPD
ncbi:MAG: helix-turn-helix domain-containing protein [Rhodospirillales bacterium]|nr:helix-turn-helix domain-containing protein [Rhodospirillales bacterium]MCB9997015.1 helix-turn-helix domain-containing protein [Rhodospirillales bacterium]